MTVHGRYVGRPMLTALTLLVPLAALAQPAPQLLPDLDALRSIQTPAPLTFRPRVFGGYGAMVTAAMLTVLYLYRGRAFIVYWIGSWLLVGASLLLLAQGYEGLRLGSVSGVNAVVLGLAQLLTAWSTGLTLLAAKVFPDKPLRWNVPLNTAAATAVWFLAAPFLVPLNLVLATGPALAAVLFGWAAVRYLRLFARTRHVGAFVIGAGTLAMCATSVVAFGAMLNVLGDANTLNPLFAVNMIVNVFIALGMHVLIFEDMTDDLRQANRELAKANEEVKRLAIIDPLTGCHNRRFLEEIERRELQRHRRYEAPLSVVFVDVNHFKRLNDSLGHAKGDEVLKAIGTLLRKQVRESDYVIRWGGDEFLLLLTCGPNEAQRKAEELKTAFERERRAAGLPEGIGLSIGVASVSAEAESLAEAIRLADSRMYRDKLGEQMEA